MSTTTTIKIPTSAVRDRLGADGANWTKGQWESEDGRMCLHGAIRACMPEPGDAHLARQVAERQGWGTAYNDATSTTWGDIDQVLIDRQEVTDADLAETFGPSWEIVVDTVRVLAAATPSQIHQLAAARDAAYTRAVARDATWSDARDAINAAMDATWNAAMDVAILAWAAADATDAAADAATEAATRDATVAAVVADLVGGEHGYTAEHHRTLAGPFAEVFPSSLLAATITTTKETPS